ncbi:MAG: nickel pincer cofactor biosynthesis protein LarC [Archaeoglobaceae archaeon]
MKVAIFDAFNGASGDMILSSLIGVSLTEEDLKETLDQLPIELSFKIEEVRKKGILSKMISVEEKKTERGFSEVMEIVEKARIEKKVKEDSKRIFEILAKAEGKIHGRDFKNAVFHEVGSDDAIFDVICSVKGIRKLIESGYRIFSNPVRVGSGFVSFSHGKYPVPVPAVLEILRNSKLELIFEGEGELLTPTAAAILAYYSEGTFKYPLKVEKVSYGAGKIESEVPNVLRLILGFSEIYDSVAMVETIVDDLSGEAIGFALERLREKNLEAIAIPAIAKKSRPATLIKVITNLSMAEDAAVQLMRETGSLGVRIIPVYHRMISDREIVEKEVELGGRRFLVRFKRSKMLGSEKPEFDDVAKIAKELEIPIFKVYRLLRCENADSERE